MATPRRTNPSIAVVGAIILFAACKRSSLATEDAAVPIRSDESVVEPTRDPGGSDATAANRITIEVVPPTTPGTGFAKRCSIGGPPLGGACSGGSLAVDAAGVLHVVHGATVLRLRAPRGDCALEPAGDPVALPPETPRPQRIDGGPLYMRSGGPAWELYAAGDAVHAFDFLGGLYRIDRGKPEPACTSEFGFRSFALVGKRWLAARNGIEEIDFGRAGKCKARPAGIDDKARGTIHAIGGALYVANHDKLHRYAGKTPTALGDGTRMCALTAMTACGDGACALDHNCPQLIQLAADGAVIRTVEASKLFDVRPYSLDDLASAPDGTVYLLAHHRDKIDGREVCEAAVYAISPAVFAR